MSLPSRSLVITWSLAPLRTTGQNADTLGAAIGPDNGNGGGLSLRTFTTIAGLNWSGVAKDSADDRAAAEQRELRTLAAAYQDLGAACLGAYDDMTGPLTRLQGLIGAYGKVVDIGDDWSVTGTPPDMTAAELRDELVRNVRGLAAADAKWAPKIIAANTDIARITSAATTPAAAPAGALAHTGNPWLDLPGRLGQPAWKIISDSGTLTAELAQLSGDGWSIE
ncbi:hypothetical protein [Nocardia sp. NPDC051570]|uniref:hypothetical protein n=1 Tax=Nocardia sp. NPDC051570 TaxID=3364324 RepID=UPI0037A67E0E